MAYSSVRSRRPVWTPDDAEELADTSFWVRPVATPRAVEDEELSSPLFSMRSTPKVVRDSPLASDDMRSPVDGKQRSRRKRTSMIDAMQLEKVCIPHYEPDSPYTEILHPMRSLVLERISGASLSPSPKDEQLPSPTSEDCEKNTDMADPLPPSPLTRDVTVSENCRKQVSEKWPPAATDQESYVIEENGKHAPDLQSPDSSTVPAAAPTPSVVMVVYDAEKKPIASGLQYAINTIVKEDDEIILVGYLQHVMSPMGHRMVADTTQFTGVNDKCLRMEAAEKRQAAERMIINNGQLKACALKKVKLSVRIAPGALPRSVIVQEAKSLHATWVIFDRNAMKEKKIYYVEHLQCNVLKISKDGRTETIRSAQSQESCKQTRDHAVAMPSLGQSVSMASSDISSHESSISLERSGTSITSTRKGSDSSSSASSWVRKFKSSFLRSGSSSAVKHQSANGSSMSSTQSSSPTPTFISNSTPEDTEYLEESDIPQVPNFEFSQVQSS